MESVATLTAASVLTLTHLWKSSGTSYHTSLTSEYLELLRSLVIHTSMVLVQKVVLFFFSEAKDSENINSMQTLSGMGAFMRLLAWLVADLEMSLLELGLLC